MATFEQELFWLDQTYPDWRTALATEVGQTHTICIPDCLDVAPHKFFGPTDPEAAGYDQQQVEKAQAQLKGGHGEENFFIQLRKLKLGGILIHGFDTKKFISVIRHKVKYLKSVEKHFECDFIFIHQQTGIVIIEVKSCNDEREMAKKYKEAVEQLNRQILGLEYLYRQISGESNCPFQVQGFVCMPNFEFTTLNCLTEIIELARVVYSFPLMGKCEMHDRDRFQQFFKGMRTDEHAYEALVADKAVEFIASITTYRSFKFATSALNALEIYRRIEKQDFKNAKMKQSQAIIFNEQQLNAIECNAKRLLITGPPGNGKTLCLLQRALNAAKVEKPGRVVVYCYLAENILPKFEQFFKANHSSEIKRTPIFISEFEADEFAPDDDWFRDESVIESGEFESAMFGFNSITVVITGLMNPEDTIDISSEAKDMYANFEHFELKTVIRGTITIIDEWKVFFPDRFLSVGHNIIGTAIERYSVATTSELFEIVHLKIKHLLTPSVTTEAASGQTVEGIEYRMHHFTPADISVLDAIVSYSESYCLCVRNYLKSYGMRCGEVTEQARDATLVAVDFAMTAASYEWPIVIVIAVHDEDELRHTDSHYMTAASRAIAKLIVVETPEWEKIQDDVHDNALKFEIRCQSRKRCLRRRSF